MSQALMQNIDNDFVNLKTNANNMCLKVVKCTCKKSIYEIVVKSKHKVLRHFKVDPVLKIDETM